jgi:hypothetical protein
MAFKEISRTFFNLEGNVFDAKAVSHEENSKYPASAEHPVLKKQKTIYFST